MNRLALPLCLLIFYMAQAIPLRAEETASTKVFEHQAERLKRIHFWISQFESTFPLIRKEAANQLASLRAVEAIDSLASHLNDPSTEVRAAIIKTLGIIGSEKTLSLIQTHLKRDRDPVVLKLGREAIRQIKEREEKKTSLEENPSS